MERKHSIWLTAQYLRQVLYIKCNLSKVIYIQRGVCNPPTAPPGPDTDTVDAIFLLSISVGSSTDTQQEYGVYKFRI